MYDNICRAVNRELSMLDEKFADPNAQMSGQELEHIDKMTHTLKSLETIEAMRGEYGYDGTSNARGRSRMTGRYVSRDEGPRYGGYSQETDGYSRRYY